MTPSILEKALEKALRLRVPILIASTTGSTAEKMLDLIGKRDVRLIVATHRARNVSPELRIPDEIRKRLAKGGHTVFEDRTLPLPVKWARWVTRLFKISAFGKEEKKIETQFGVGGRVCLKIAQQAFERGFLRRGQSVVAVAGKEAGAGIAVWIEVNGPLASEIRFCEVIERRL
ncbi:MAG TPA: pyruvate kinase alpha/beta domain-containing protein [Candidatus Omnitrophota bacterium]|nr:pyruvate kinase alpha/beta domain-containing protein [Candidatus Omnitrophota bacterium]